MKNGNIFIIYANNNSLLKSVLLFTVRQAYESFKTKHNLLISITPNHYLSKQIVNILCPIMLKNQHINPSYKGFKLLIPSWKIKLPFMILLDFFANYLLWIPKGQLFSNSVYWLYLMWKAKALKATSYQPLGPKWGGLSPLLDLPNQ